MQFNLTAISDKNTVQKTIPDGVYVTAVVLSGCPHTATKFPDSGELIFQTQTSNVKRFMSTILSL